MSETTGHIITTDDLFSTVRTVETADVVADAVATTDDESSMAYYEWIDHCHRLGYAYMIKVSVYRRTMKVDYMTDRAALADDISYVLDSLSLEHSVVKTSRDFDDNFHLSVFVRGSQLQYLDALFRIYTLVYDSGFAFMYIELNETEQEYPAFHMSTTCWDDKTKKSRQMIVKSFIKELVEYFYKKFDEQTLLRWLRRRVSSRQMNMDADDEYTTSIRNCYVMMEIESSIKGFPLSPEENVSLFKSLYNPYKILPFSEARLQTFGSSQFNMRQYIIAETASLKLQDMPIVNVMDGDVIRLHLPKIE